MNTRLPSARAQTRLLGHARRAAAGLGPLGGVEAAGGVVVDGVQVRPRLSGVRHDHRAHHLLRHPNHPRWSSCTDSKSNTKSAVSSIAFRARTLTARDARIHQPVASAQPSAFRLGWRGTLHPGLTAPPPFPPPPLHSHADRRSLSPRQRRPRHAHRLKTSSSRRARLVARRARRGGRAARTVPDAAWGLGPAPKGAGAASTSVRPFLQAHYQAFMISHKSQRVTVLEGSCEQAGRACSWLGVGRG